MNDDREGFTLLLPPPPRASPRSLYHLSPLFFLALSGSSGRCSVTHAHLRTSTACQHSHSMGQIFGKLSIAVVRQRSSPRFFSYSYLVHTVFIVHKLSLSLSLSETPPLTSPSISFVSSMENVFPKKKKKHCWVVIPTGRTRTALNCP